MNANTTRTHEIEMITTVFVNGKRTNVTLNPETAVDIDTDAMTPIFRDESGKYFTIPGQDAANVYQSWLAQFI